jgi:CHAT domain-containing protein
MESQLHRLDPGDAVTINGIDHRISAVHRAIQQCAERQGNRARLIVDPVPSATATDFRRKLLDNYDIIHFAGHANKDELVFETESGGSDAIPISTIAEAVGRNHSVKAVVLNACNSASALPRSISPCTIGMTDTVDDDAAIEFTRGFYDSILQGKSPEIAFEEGQIAVKMAKFDASHIVLLK